MIEGRSKLLLIRLAFVVGAALSCTPLVSPAVAFTAGIALTLSFGNPFLLVCQQWAGRLLALSIMGIGAGMDLAHLWRYGVGSLGYTVIEIAAAMIAGLWLGKRLGTEKILSTLITSGVTICGGSAIAVIALVTRADPDAITIAMAVIFLFNGIGMFLLPWLGHLAHFDPVQFGLWSALALTDTSSVVGATMRYGKLAVEVGTNAKLARALWIFPMAFLFRRWTKTGESTERRGKRSFPWFMVGFVALAALVTWIPALRPAGEIVAAGAKQLLVLTLFVMGSTLTRDSLERVGARPLVQGTVLWVVIGITTFVALQMQWIR